MRVKLFDTAKNDYNDINSLLYQVLENREIDDSISYFNLINDKSVEYDFNLLDNILTAKDKLLKTIEKENHIHIIVDSDPDGYCSSAMLYSYIVNEIGYNNISYSLHTGKQHGISNDIKIPKETKLLLIPDASSNEEDIHKTLYDKGIDIVVLDHHLAESYSKYATVVNNQLSENYPNKELSGAGIVYKFLKALDEDLWLNGADNYLDLVALALISDNMDMRSLETRYYTNLGLNNIKNKCFKAFVDKRSYDIKNHISINNIAFYITPLINALIRMGKQDEKELLFQAFIESDMTFKYKKRGQDELIDETIYERAARLSYNAKSRQGREIDKIIDSVIDEINTKQKYKNNIIVVNAKDINKSLTGIIAIKVASYYKKPCLVIRKDESTDCYSGSGRNIDYSEIVSLKDYITNTKLANAEGHDNAFGIMNLKSENVNKLIEVFNNDKSIGESLYLVDFIVPFEDLSDEFIFTINNLKDNWGTGIKEPVIVIKDIDVHNEEISVLGKNLDTLKVNVDGIEFIKFKCPLSDKLINNKNDMIRLNIVGRCGVNEWEGKVTPQIIIEDYEIIT